VGDVSIINKVLEILSHHLEGPVELDDIMYSRIEHIPYKVDPSIKDSDDTKKWIKPISFQMERNVLFSNHSIIYY
jgi:hypothetical protein